MGFHAVFQILDALNPMKEVNFSSTSSLKTSELEDGYAHMNALANAAFGREVLRKVTDVILPLNDRGTGSAFYCVHDLTGMATGFRFMAQMLGPKQRFYGIQVPTKKRNAEFASSIESISQYYADELIKFQPEGNLVLGGYSTGAIIALEMAQQLRGRGREVSLLVVIDGELFNTGAEISANNPFYWLKLIWNLPGSITGVVKDGYSFQTFSRKIINKVIAMRKTVIAKMRGESLIRTLNAEDFVSINFNHCSPEHRAFMNELFEVQFRYIPKKYSGRVLVYARKTHGLTHLSQVGAMWREIAPASEIVYVGGTHITMMRRPDGFAVAKHLAERMAEIDSPPSHVNLNVT
jgi:thioesterase domain-containing protein